MIAPVRIAANAKKPRVPALTLTIEQAAESLNLSQRTLAALVKSDEIPYLHIGRRLLFPTSELRRWLTAQTKQVVAQPREA